MAQVCTMDEVGQIQALDIGPAAAGIIPEWFLMRISTALTKERSIRKNHQTAQLEHSIGTMKERTIYRIKGGEYGDKRLFPGETGTGQTRTAKQISAYRQCPAPRGRGAHGTALCDG